MCHESRPLLCAKTPLIAKTGASANTHFQGHTCCTRYVVALELQNCPFPSALFLFECPFTANVLNLDTMIAIRMNLSAHSGSCGVILGYAFAVWPLFPELRWYLFSSVSTDQSGELAFRGRACSMGADGSHHCWSIDREQQQKEAFTTGSNTQNANCVSACDETNRRFALIQAHGSKHQATNSFIGLRP